MQIFNLIQGTYYIKDYIPNARLYPKPPWDIKDYMVEGRVFNRKKNHIIAKAYVQINTDDDYVSKI